MAAEQSGNLRLDGLRQQRSRAVAQYLGQRTFDGWGAGSPAATHAIWTRSKNRCTQPKKGALSASLKIRHVVSKAIHCYREQVLRGDGEAMPAIPRIEENRFPAKPFGPDRDLVIWRGCSCTVTATPNTRYL
jgi:hypothetical protein